MSMNQIKKQVIEYANKIGIDKIGFTTAEPFVLLEERLMNQQALDYQSGFEEKDIKKRVEPVRVLPGAKSIISIALAYPSRIRKQLSSTKENRRGMFARTSWGEDYHILVKEKLNLLLKYIEELEPTVEAISMVDTGELVDRAVAERAGIGWSGKNCSIITEEFGSYVFLGEIVTNIAFEADEPISDGCLDCTKCLEACPTNALVAPGQINAKACIAYLTQTKDIIPLEYRDKIGNRIYGCDSCQTACPKNKGMDHHLHTRMEPDEAIIRPILIEMLQLSNRQFKEQYGHLSGAWRGKKPLQRNALHAIAHYKDEKAIPYLREMLMNEVTVYLRATAAWTLGKIGTDECMEILQKQMLLENENVVKQEISLALSGMNME